MSIIRADSIKNRAGDGAPDFPNGITVTGIVTATTLNQNVTGVTTFAGNVDINADLDVDGHTNLDNLSVAGVGTVAGNFHVGGVLTYEDVTNVDSVGMVTARAGLKVTGGTSYFAGAIAAAGAITGTASTATTITVSSDTTDTLCFPVFTNTGVGNNAPKVNTSRLSFNSSTGQLSATSYVGDGSALTGIDATTIQTGNNKVQTSATSISNIIGNAGIATITAQGLNVTGIVTATSMKVFSSGIDYEWQGGTSMAWWKSEDIVSTSSWPAAKGGSDANLVSHNGGTTGLSYNATDASFNNYKTIQQSGNNTGGLRTSNQDSGYWWNGSDAFTVIMALRKESHTSGSSYGDSYFVHNVNTGNESNSWSIGPFGDHTWGGQYGEMWGGIQNYYEGLEMRFSYPWRGLFMVRMNTNFGFGELSVNGGSGWQRLDMRHNGPSGLGSSWRSMSIFTNNNGASGHTAVGRIAEWAYFRNKRLGGNELDAITKSWCNKFNF